MTRELAIPTALDTLDHRLTTRSAPEDLYQVLRVLQQHGLTQTELQIHVERTRAINDRGARSDVVEDNSMLALDIIAGNPSELALRWDPAELARIYLPEALEREALETAVGFAFMPNNLLPPRPADHPPHAQIEWLVENELSRLELFESEPTRAEFFRVPKLNFASRPAALLAPNDRLLYEALASVIVDALNSELPTNVSWPRSRSAPTIHPEHSLMPLEWGSRYVVYADVDSFFESVHHGFLALTISSEFHQSRAYVHAVEAFLTAVMGTELGLPQGPKASDIFSSAYLLPIDKWMETQGWEFVRYADDYFFEAESVVKGRRRLEQLEAALREYGLRLNPGKTRVMKAETYQTRVLERSPRVLTFQSSLRDITEERLRDTDDPDEIEAILTDIGADEELLWGLIYHGTLTIEEVIDEVRDLLNPSLIDSYAEYLIHMSSELRSSRSVSDMVDAERDLIECLINLAGAGRYVQLSDIDHVLRWFPRLAPYVSGYLSSIANVRRREVRDFLVRWLKHPTETDWTTAWLCQTLEASPSLVVKRTVPLLETLAVNQSVGLLTRMGALRALATSGALTKSVWGRVLLDASPAVRAELLFTALADSAAYPWVSESDYPDSEVLALEAGDEGSPGKHE